MDFIESVAKGFPILVIWVLMMVSFLMYSSAMSGLAFGVSKRWHKPYAIAYSIALVVFTSYIFGRGL